MVDGGVELCMATLKDGGCGAMGGCMIGLGGRRGF